MNRNRLITLKKIISVSSLLNLSCILYGYSFWLLLNQHNSKALSVALPVHVYNDRDYIVQAPETIDALVEGKRNQLSQLAYAPSAITIDIEALGCGCHTILINSDNLLLPDKIKLVNYSPFTITITKK